MAVSRRKWIIGVSTLALATVLGGGFWFAHRRGWLGPIEGPGRKLVSQVEAWLRKLTSKDKAEESGGGMAGMDMGSMAGEAEPSGVEGYAALEVAPEVQQRIGVTFGRVERERLRMSVRTVGIIRPDETKEARVHLRTEGWVVTLYVNYTGQEVRKGAPLLQIYSPEFLRTQLDYVTAMRAQRGSVAAGERSLGNMALQKLRLLDVSEPELTELEQTGKPREYMTLRSPVNGTVLAKDVLEGEYVTPGKELYDLADLSTVWVQAKVYEYELPHIELGKAATVTVAALPGREFPGRVVFIKPTVEEATRTVEVRVELPNRDGKLKPGMFADIVIRHDMGEGLLVPTEAVIRTGTRDIVFRVEEGQFMPVEVEIGAIKFDDRFQVLKGLETGDRVVTSANFLIDSESRLRLGGGGMAGMAGVDMGGGEKGMKGPGGMEGSGTRGMPSKSRGKGVTEGTDMEGMDHSKMKH
jgi:Cu(I)/Ag(I) efflux system membrane fusion protein